LADLTERSRCCSACQPPTPRCSQASLRRRSRRS